MTLSHLQGHSLVRKPFKCDFSYIFAADDKISTDIARRSVPLREIFPVFANFI